MLSRAANQRGVPQGGQPRQWFSEFDELLPPETQPGSPQHVLSRRGPQVKVIRHLDTDGRSPASQPLSKLLIQVVGVDDRLVEEGVVLSEAISKLKNLGGWIIVRQEGDPDVSHWPLGLAQVKQGREELLFGA